MINHAIWAMGVCGDLLILVVLFTRRRFPQFPWFTLLIAFHFLIAVGLKAHPHFSSHAVVIIDAADVLLQCAVLAELAWIALQPVVAPRRLLLPFPLVAGAVLVVMRFAPPAHHSLHSLLLVLRLEWAIVLVFLLRPLRLSWRSHVTAISFGYSVFSAHQLAVDGYFATGRELSDYAASPFFRIAVYLLVVSWWLVTLWLEDPSAVFLRK